MLPDIDHPTVLVIDDDPHIADTIQLLLPDWVVLYASNGVDGIELVRASPDRLRLVILDLQMPHDGIYVAVQIRSIAPELRILPYSGAPTFIDELVALGCAPLLTKALPLDQQRAHIAQVIESPAPPSVQNPLMPLLLKGAQESEATVRYRRSGAWLVALLASPGVRASLQTAIAAAGAVVYIDVPSAQVLRLTLQRMRATLIIADMRTLTDAASIARSFGLPLVVAAFSLTAGYRATGLAQGVIVDPADSACLAAAIAAVTTGAVYHDPALMAPLVHSPLTERECEIGYRLLQGHEIKEIAEALAMTAETVRWHQHNIYAKLNVKSMNQFLAWAEAYSPTP